VNICRHFMLTMPLPVRQSLDDNPELRRRNPRRRTTDRPALELAIRPHAALTGTERCCMSRFGVLRQVLMGGAMLGEVTAALRKAVRQLRGESARMERQISAIESALIALDGRGRQGRPGRRERGRRSMPGVARPRAVKARARLRMSPMQRKAVSARMKVYWAKRKRKGVN